MTKIKSTSAIRESLEAAATILRQDPLYRSIQSAAHWIAHDNLVAASNITTRHHFGAASKTEAVVSGIILAAMEHTPREHATTIELMDRAVRHFQFTTDEGLEIERSVVSLLEKTPGFEYHGMLLRSMLGQTRTKQDQRAIPTTSGVWLRTK